MYRRHRRQLDRFCAVSWQVSIGAIIFVDWLEQIREFGFLRDVFHFAKNALS